MADGDRYRQRPRQLLACDHKTLNLHASEGALEMNLHRILLPVSLVVLVLMVVLNPFGAASDRFEGISGPNINTAVYYVATDGDDDGGDGSPANPWATITRALDSVPDGSTILVRPGTYDGRVRLRGTFSQGVTVRSEVPYQARLRHDSTVVTCFYGQGIILEGFDISHSGPGAGALVVQIQDLRGEPGGDDVVSRITLRNNVLHDSHNNDILKINNGAMDVLVEGNLFYNQEGSDEHIDVNSVANIIVQDNVFFNDFAGSGRTDDDTSSFIVIKDSNGDSDGRLGSEHIIVRRNVFAHWEGSSGQGFVRAGEDGTANYEARDVLVENNLMIGNNTQQIRSPFQMMGVYSVTVRSNTVSGDMPAKEYGARIFAYGPNPDNDQIHLHNNIWSDPSGTMGDTFNRGDNTHNLTFDNNLFWNDDQPFPTSSESIIEVIDDAHRIVGDPALGAQAGLVLPRWDSGAGRFADGSATIRQAFERLVALYGTPAEESPAIDAADAAHAPGEDILGNPRPVGPAPDVGALEYQGFGFSLRAEPSFQAIAPGENAQYTLHVEPVGAFSADVALAHSAAPPNIEINLAPTVVAPPGTASLTITDTHAGSLLPGVRHRIVITGSAAGLTEAETIWLLVGGVRLYLPTVIRTDVGL
jgi:hypothetical protein